MTFILVQIIDRVEAMILVVPAERGEKHANIQPWNYHPRDIVLHHA
jgi:hypothetical protein